jgi:apolipoprotein D and lipocalin family protein
VARVDLDRYVGTWYEVAKIPNRFQKDCAGGTTATYTRQGDGKIEVVNRCRKADGSEQRARGIAKVVDAQSHARLKVSFVSFLGIRPFWGDYWVLGLGENYEYAVVGTPDRKYGWILSRTPELPPETLETIWATVASQGYDPVAFTLSAP